MPDTRILIIEDEVKIAQLLKDYLSRDGFAVEMLHEGGTAVTRFRELQPDFVILDLMLPEKDGVAICRELREFSDVPIMMLTARIDEIDRLIGLEVGADDYVCKPFLPREVVARVHTILRRTNKRQPEQPSNQLIWKDITLNLENYQCYVGSRLVELTPVEFRLLATMLDKPGRVFSRDELMRSAYHDERIVSDRTIDSHVKNLRRKLSEASCGESPIQSIYGMGYKAI